METLTAQAFVPATSTVIDLARPLSSLEPGCGPDGSEYGRVITLVRLHDELIGVTELRGVGAGLDRFELAGELWRQFESEIRGHCIAHGCAQPPQSSEALLDGLGERVSEPRFASPAPRVTVVVPTAGRPGRIDSCLSYLRRLAYPDFEVLVVDNAPADGATWEVVQAHAAVDRRVRYVAEPLPGSSVARNRGIREASSEILAFTDDDVHVEPDWLSWLVSPLIEDAQVGVVTGLILPERLSTPEQEWFESYSGFGKGLRPAKFDLASFRPADRPLFPYWGGVFGSGNNMAFRRSVLLAMGGFDPAMGAGSRALGGADVASFSQAVLDGHRLAYEPRAIGWHDHRATEAALRKQTFSYAVGLTAVFTKWILRHPPFAISLAREAVGVLAGLLRARRARRATNRPAPEVSQFAVQLRMNRERGVLGRQIAGFALGPVLYLRSVVWARRLGLYRVLPRPADLVSGTRA